MKLAGLGLGVGAALLMAGCADLRTQAPAARGPLPDRAVVYVPVSRSMEVTAGELMLSSGMATFKERKGTMLLQYSRRLGESEVAQDSWFGEVGGPEVYLYKVMNDQLYYNANRGRNGVCETPVKWMAFSPKANGDLALCEVVDPAGSVDSNRPTVCGCGVYAKQGQ